LDEKTKADMYIAYLDQILAGEKDIKPVEDVEIEKLLLLAKTMIAADVSVNSKTRENLRKKLLALLTKKNKSSLRVLSKNAAAADNDEELDEEALNYVAAAGFAGQAGEQQGICPYCSARTPKLGGKCPLCSE
jgi:hypothetical protein